MVVRNAIYHEMNEMKFIPDDQSYEWDDVRDAEKDDYFEVFEQDVSVNHNDPTVHGALDALDKVREFPRYGVSRRSA